MSPRPEKGPAYDFPLETQVWAVVDAFRDHRESYLRTVAANSGRDGEEALQMVQDFSKALLTTVEGLTAMDALRLFQEAVRPSTANESQPEPFPNRLRLAFEAVMVELGYLVCDMLDDAEKRIYDLLWIAAEIQPSRATAAFLRRVSRCYLFGFDAECIVMCRAALDAEFQAEISADDCCGLLGQRPSRREGGGPAFDLSDRIEVARLQQRISAETAGLAHEVRRAGNAVIHRSPQIEHEARKVVYQTMCVLAELHGDDWPIELSTL